MHCRIWSTKKFHLFLSPVSTVSTTGVDFWNYLHFLYWEYKDFLKWLEIVHIIENMGNPRDIFQLIIHHKLKITPVYFMKDRGDVSAYSCIHGSMFWSSSPRNSKSTSLCYQNTSRFLDCFRMSKVKAKLWIFLFWNLKFIRIKNCHSQISDPEGRVVFLAYICGALHATYMLLFIGLSLKGMLVIHG